MEHEENADVQPSVVDGPQISADTTELVVEETEYIPALVQDS